MFYQHVHAIDDNLSFLIEDTLYDDEHIYGTDDLAVGVCAIIGQNGSGKSTILDMIIRVLNNVAASLAGEDVLYSAAEHLHYIENVYGAILFLQDDNVYQLCVEGHNITLVEYTKTEINGGVTYKEKEVRTSLLTEDEFKVGNLLPLRAKVSPMLLALVKDGIEADFSESQMNALEAWQKAKCFSLVQFYHYFEYVTERSRFATHQGVKGLQFPRVMAIYQDASARGNLFSYEKSFGVAGLSDTEMKNKREGKETSVERTMRLLYVTCSRAMDSLALVVYSSSPDKVREFCLNKKWFNTEEIIMWPRNTERQ